jgi:hypothetical protein
MALEGNQAHPYTSEKKKSLGLHVPGEGLTFRLSLTRGLAAARTLLRLCPCLGLRLCLRSILGHAVILNNLSLRMFKLVLYVTTTLHLGSGTVVVEGVCHYELDLGNQPVGSGSATRIS